MLPHRPRSVAVLAVLAVLALAAAPGQAAPPAPPPPVTHHQVVEHNLTPSYITALGGLNLPGSQATSARSCSKRT